MGEGEIASGSCNLAGRQAHCSVSRRPSGELVMLEYTVVRSVYYCRYASVSPNRIVQCASGTVQERRLFTTEEDGYVYIFDKYVYVYLELI